MPKVTEEHRQARRKQIADAALRCFARKGFQRTSMADIIAESGLSAGAIYGHYKSKSDIAVLVAGEVVAAVVTDKLAVDETGPIPEPADVIGALMTTLGENMVAPGILVQIWAEAVTDERILDVALGVLDQLKSVMGGYLTLWLVRERGLSEGEAANIARTHLPILLGIRQGYIIQSALLPGFDREGYLDSIHSIRFE